MNRDWCQVVIQIRHQQHVGPTVEHLSTFQTFYKYMPLAQQGHQVSRTVRQSIYVNRTSSHTSLSRLACLTSFWIKFYSLCLFSRSQVLPSASLYWAQYEQLESNDPAHSPKQTTQMKNTPAPVRYPGSPQKTSQATTWVRHSDNLLPYNSTVNI